MIAVELPKDGEQSAFRECRSSVCELPAAVGGHAAGGILSAWNQSENREMSVSLPPRPDDAHKGTFGRVLIVAGSPGMSGAACLAATAALRSGAGLVTAAVPCSIQAVTAGFEPSYTTIGLPCEPDGQVSIRAVGLLEDRLAPFHAVAVGPGLGQTEAARCLVAHLIGHVGVPLILDADALNLVAAHRMCLERSAATVVTQHPGEFSRLTERSIDHIHAHRMSCAQEYAVRTGAIVVLKGARTVVTDGRSTVVNKTGNSGMATGGSGDVLTGIVAALCGQGMAAFDAAVTATHVHGLAGDLCAADRSERGMIASDLLQFLGAAWKRLEP